MIPGEIFPAPGEITLNAGRPAITLMVANTGDRPVQVGSHYHFAETNPGLDLDRIAALIDEGTPDYTLAAMAKFYSGQTAVFCANYAVELHGGYGYIDEYACQKWYRDAKILEIGEGTSEVQRMLIARGLGLPVE